MTGAGGGGGAQDQSQADSASFTPLSRGLLWKKHLPGLADRPSGATEAPGRGAAGSGAHPHGCAVAQASFVGPVWMPINRCRERAPVRSEVVTLGPPGAAAAVRARGGGVVFKKPLFYSRFIAFLKELK